ncbi:hypothetical protein BS47DRAFT_75460 [Hydnum rufescens UP504]|uniref:Uncharacterized protein n=1 Tax=Hydnum rufescens UP504 TaxID=1448309 RepID=A0A9P6B8E2_9AGAM|nr:hypothetical protein BS47DRAFT_75460 [Hydnum rufescens UP504]
MGDSHLCNQPSSLVRSYYSAISRYASFPLTYFTGRGSSAPSRGRSGAFSSRGGGTSVRGGISGSSSGTARGGSASTRGSAHGAPRGPSFRNNAHSYKSSGASQSFTSGISSPSFNPQLLNGQSLSSFPSGSLRTGRHSHSFTYGRDREGTPKREEGSKKTLTDFRIIGVDCPALGWSWGTIVTAPDEPPSAPANPPEALEPESDANLRPATPTRTADATKPSEVPTPTAAPAPSSISESLPKLPTETSRIRLYFNSPVEFEEKPAQSHPADRNRGGKRKKEHDEGEPEEGSKRKKEDADHSSMPDSHVAYLSIPPRPMDSTPLLFKWCACSEVWRRSWCRYCTRTYEWYRCQAQGPIP